TTDRERRPGRRTRHRRSVRVMTSPDPTMPVCVLFTERGHGDLGIGHPYDIFWRIPRDHTGSLRRALTDALTGCGFHQDPGRPRYWDGPFDLPKLPGNITVWRGDDDTLTIGRAAQAHHRVRAEHTEALRHAILAVLHDRATDPGRDFTPPLADPRTTTEQHRTDRRFGCR
ncbi:MAG: hypothetical protein ACR2GH_13345, partial [Pseudonocardia sp.]